MNNANCPNCGSKNITSQYITVVKENGPVECHNILCNDCGYSGNIENINIDEGKFRKIIFIVVLIIIISTFLFIINFINNFSDIF